MPVFCLVIHNLVIVVLSLTHTHTFLLSSQSPYHDDECNIPFPSFFTLRRVYPKDDCISFYSCHHYNNCCMLVIEFMGGCYGKHDGCLSIVVRRKLEMPFMSSRISSRYWLHIVDKPNYQQDFPYFTLSFLYKFIVFITTLSLSFISNTLYNRVKCHCCM